MGVPDARITIDAVSITPDDPVVDGETGVNVVVSSSVGSAEPANVSEIRLLDPDGAVRDVSPAPGSLSPGDDLDTTLWTTFDEPGEHRLTVEVIATEPTEDDDPSVVRVQRDVVVTVSPDGTAVPDARLTIESVGVGPTAPVVGERVGVNASVVNSAGSTEPANVSEIRLRDPDGTVREVAPAPGSLSPGDDLDTTLWTAFDEPGEHRLIVEAVSAGPIDTSGAGVPSSPVVRVQREIVLDVEPADVAIDLRATPVSPEALRDDDGDDGVAVGEIEGVDGLFGGTGSGLDADEPEPISGAVSAPIVVTVVNTGTIPADRVHLTASETPMTDGTVAADVSADPDDAPDGQPIDVGPYVVEDVAPGEERQVVVDLGSMDRRSNVTVTAAFRSDAGPPDADGASRTSSADLTYPPREGQPTITGTTVTRTVDGRLVVDGNLANVGERSISGVTVDVGTVDGVPGTPEGESYFIGTVGESDFVPFEFEATANESATDTLPIRIEYTDRGIRYVETVHVGVPSAEGPAGDGSLGSSSGLGIIAIGGGLLGITGLAIAVFVAKRRDV